MQTVSVIAATSCDQFSKYKHKYKPNTNRRTNMGMQITDRPNPVSVFDFGIETIEVWFWEFLFKN